MSRRTDRVEDVLRAAISGLLLREVRDPRVQMASVSRVEVTPDLKRARVHVSVLGADEQRDAALTALRHAAGFVRSRLARELRNMRSIPELHFELDRGAEYSQRISDLLEAVHDDDQGT